MTRLISIEGNIGSGKSTFVEKLRLYYSNPDNCFNKKICFLQEPVDVWNTITDEHGKTVIECFYADNKKYAFAFQMMAYISRLANIKQALKQNYDIIIMERCLLTDRNVFAQMLYDDKKINEIEYKIYNKWFDEFLADFPNIEYIYLKTDPTVASERIIKRARLGETIPLEYLIKCHEYHNKWLDTMEPKYILDCNVDNTENSEIISEWINKISQWIRGYRLEHNFVTNKEDEYLLTFDGASRGNPGMCGAGYVIWRNDEQIIEGKKYINDRGTNNYAEYCALMIGLQRCADLNIKNINIKGDSLLIIKQIKQEYKITAENLLPFYIIIMEILKNINLISCEHIPRERNKHADRLANQAIDEHIKVQLKQSNLTKSVDSESNSIGVWQRS